MQEQEKFKTMEEHISQLEEAGFGVYRVKMLDYHLDMIRKAHENPDTLTEANFLTEGILLHYMIILPRHAAHTETWFADGRILLVYDEYLRRVGIAIERKELSAV